MKLENIQLVNNLFMHNEMNVRAISLLLLLLFFARCNNAVNSNSVNMKKYKELDRSFDFRLLILDRGNYEGVFMPIVKDFNPKAFKEILSVMNDNLKDADSFQDKIVVNGTSIPLEVIYGLEEYNELSKSSFLERSTSFLQVEDEKLVGALGWGILREVMTFTSSKFDNLGFYLSRSYRIPYGISVAFADIHEEAMKVNSSSVEIINPFFPFLEWDGEDLSFEGPYYHELKVEMLTRIKDELIQNKDKLSKSEELRLNYEFVLYVLDEAIDKRLIILNEVI